jgi:dihydroxycyclohexadiene carboxylate dehydrogenase
MQLQRFTGKLAVVTGAAQGIGRATAQRIAEEGGRVVIVDRAAQAANETMAVLRDMSLDVSLVLADLSTWAGARNAFDQIIAEHGVIDVLVNNVGGTRWIKPFIEYEPEEIQIELERSLWPTIWSCRAVLPHMVERRKGAVVNVGSNAVRGIYRVPYATAKGGVMSITTSLAVELAGTGVRVNCVAPGGTDVEHRPVPRNADPLSDREIDWGAEMRTFVKHQMPMGRRGQVDEQAAAIAFFASDDASFITGQILSVAGGASV